MWNCFSSFSSANTVNCFIFETPEIEGKRRASLSYLNHSPPHSSNPCSCCLSFIPFSSFRSTLFHSPTSCTLTIFALIACHCSKVVGFREYEFRKSTKGKLRPPQGKEKFVPLSFSGARKLISIAPNTHLNNKRMIFFDTALP